AQPPVQALHVVVRPHPPPPRLTQVRHGLGQLRTGQQVQRLHQLAHPLIAGILLQHRVPPPRYLQRRRVVEEPVQILTELPQRPQLRQVAEHLPQRLVFLGVEPLETLDDQEAMSPHDPRLVPVARATAASLLLLPPAQATAPPFPPGTPTPCLRLP